MKSERRESFKQDQKVTFWMWQICDVKSNIPDFHTILFRSISEIIKNHKKQMMEARQEQKNHACIH
jgi:hypothetical protein